MYPDCDVINPPPPIGVGLLYLIITTPEPPLIPNADWSPHAPAPPPVLIKPASPVCWYPPPNPPPPGPPNEPVNPPPPPPPA